MACHLVLQYSVKSTHVSPPKSGQILCAVLCGYHMQDLSLPAEVCDSHVSFAFLIWVAFVPRALPFGMVSQLELQTALPGKFAFWHCISELPLRLLLDIACQLCL